MRKLLSLLTISVLSASSVATVISCSSSPTKTKGLTIASKIINKTIYISKNVGNDTSNIYTAQAILKLLKSINSSNTSDNTKNLTMSDLSDSALADATLSTNKTKVNLTIFKTSKNSVIVPLEIALNPENKTPNHFYAPYFDIGQLYKYKNDFATLYNNNGIKALTIAFLQHSPSKDKPTADDPIGLSWAGVSIDKNDPNAAIIANAIQKYNAVGGKSIISFGGSAGITPWASKTVSGGAGASVDDIVKSFEFVIKTYNPYGLDFDIEGSQLSDIDGNKNLIQAMNKIKENHPKLYVGYTIAVDPLSDIKTALNPNFLTSWNYLLKNSNFAPVINGMAMDYGSEYDGDMFDPIPMTTKILGRQMVQDANASWNIHNLADAYTHLGMTPMIGNNDTAGQVFTKNDMMKTSHYASVNGFALLSNWSLTRDNGGRASNYNSDGLFQSKYEFSNIAEKTFGNSSDISVPVSGNLIVAKFGLSQNSIAVSWTGAENVNSYIIKIDGKNVGTASGSSSGYAYYNTKLTKGNHNVEVVALGGLGSFLISNQFTVNTANSQLTRPLINFDISQIYHGGELVYYHGAVVLVSWYKNAGSDLNPGQFQKWGPLSDFTNSLSQVAINDFTNGTLPNWYFANDPTPHT